MRLWVQTILPSLVTTLLYLLVFGQGVGGRIQDIQGIQYITYITPGLVMMAITTNAFANVSSSLYGMRFQKSIEEILVSPISDSLFLTGMVLGGMVRGLIVGCGVTLLALFFTALPVSHPWLLAAIVASTALLFSLAGFLNALFAKSFDDISIIPNFILTPLTYLSGVFYPIEALPSFWAKLAVFNPLVYIGNVFRYALFGVSEVSVGPALLIVLSCCLTLIALNLYLLKSDRGLRG